MAYSEDTVECWNCGGTGEIDSCMEDTCVCLEPPCMTARCEVCNGTGGIPFVEDGEAGETSGYTSADLRLEAGWRATSLDDEPYSGSSEWNLGWQYAWMFSALELVACRLTGHLEKSEQARLNIAGAMLEINPDQADRIIRLWNIYGPPGLAVENLVYKAVMAIVTYDRRYTEWTVGRVASLLRITPGEILNVCDGPYLYLSGDPGTPMTDRVIETDGE